MQSGYPLSKQSVYGKYGFAAYSFDSACAVEPLYKYNDLGMEQLLGVRTLFKTKWCGACASTEETVGGFCFQSLLTLNKFKIDYP